MKKMIKFEGKVYDSCTDAAKKLQLELVTFYDWHRYEQMLQYRVHGRMGFMTITKFQARGAMNEDQLIMEKAFELVKKAFSGKAPLAQRIDALNRIKNSDDMSIKTMCDVFRSKDTVRS